MEVSTREVEGVTVVDLTGRVLGGPESDALRGELDRLLTEGVRSLLINLTDVPWMNSAGLGVFLSAYSRMKELGGDLRLFGVGPRVHEILRTTKLLTVLAVLDDEETGIRSFRQGADPRPGEGRSPAGAGSEPGSE